MALEPDIEILKSDFILRNPTTQETSCLNPHDFDVWTSKTNAFQ